MGAVWGAPHSALELREEVAPETVEFAGFLESVCFRPVIFCFANLSAMKADLLFDEIVGCFYGIWHIASRMWLSRCTQQWPPLWPPQIWTRPDCPPHNLWSPFSGGCSWDLKSSLPQTTTRIAGDV